MTRQTATRLSELTRELGSCRQIGAGDPEIFSIEYDSRRVQRGSLFVALRGLKADGRTFVAEAVSRGAAAIVTDAALDQTISIPAVHVEDARRALAELAWALHGHPERALTLTGITGTNGKTTVASVLRSVLERAGRKCGLAGTLGVQYGDADVESPRTTPESADLAIHLAKMRDLQFSHVVMEVTSIGMDLKRSWGLPFQVTVFTNLTRDHLDYHGSLEAYREAKLRLFREQAADGTAIINRDDPEAERFAAAARGRVRTFALDRDADYRARDIQLQRSGTSFTLKAPTWESRIVAPLVGLFNVSNLLAVAAAADGLGVTTEQITSALREVKPVRGRAETVPSSAPFSVIVDYAHTPDALEKILTALRDLSPARILLVVGAGGDRDRGKRPFMAETSARFSDIVFLTSDNPRSEDPEAILDDLEAGLPAGSRFVRNADRGLAIGLAIAEAREGDIVLIAGKGHESYQEIQGIRHPFDDRAVAADWLKRAGYA